MKMTEEYLGDFDFEQYDEENIESEEMIDEYLQEQRRIDKQIAEAEKELDDIFKDVTEVE